MKRGDVVVAAASGDYGKPRPYLVVQTDTLNDTHASLLLCPITSDLRAWPYRVDLAADGMNGLQKASQIMTDKAQAIRRDRIGKVIGQADALTLQQVSRMLAFVFGLAEGPA